MITETQADWAARKLESDYGDPRERLNALLIIQAWRDQADAIVAKMKRDMERREREQEVFEAKAEIAHREWREAEARS